MVILCYDQMMNSLHCIGCHTFISPLGLSASQPKANFVFFSPPGFYRKPKVGYVLVAVAILFIHF